MRYTRRPYMLTAVNAAVLASTAKQMDAAQLASVSATAPPAALASEAYMGRTAAAFEALTGNMNCLSQSMLSMQQLMQHQSR
jgi:hypothetical protein